MSAPSALGAKPGAMASLASTRDSRIARRPARSTRATASGFWGASAGPPAVVGAGVLRTNVRRGDSIHRSGGGSLTTRRRRRRGTCNALVESVDVLLSLADSPLTELLTPFPDVLTDGTLDVRDMITLSDNSADAQVETTVADAMAGAAEAVAATLLGDEAVAEMAQTVTLVTDQATEVLVQAAPPMLWARYLSQLATHPIRTKCITAFYLYSFSDTITQMLLEKLEFADVNQDRVLRFATFGILDGFMGHNWYGILDKFVARFVDDGPIAVATKVAADQLLYAPLWYTMFFSVLGLMEGQAPAAVRTRIVEDVPKMVVTNWKVWIPVMIVSFQFIPRDLRVLWTLSVMVVYMAFLSAKSSNSDPHGPGGDSKPATTKGTFDVQARLRGEGVESLDILAARERSALFLVQYFNRSLFLKHREGNAPEVVPPTVTITNPIPSPNSKVGAGSTKIFIHCTDQEGLFGAIAHALVAEAITIRNWQCDVRGDYYVSSGEVVDETGGPVTDAATVARLQSTLALLTGQGLPDAHPAKCQDTLAEARDDWREDLAASREMLRELQSEVREMPADDAKQLMASTSVSFATVEVSPTASVDELTVTMTVEDRPGVLSRVLEEMYEANYEVKEATIQQDGDKLVKQFTLRALPEAAPVSGPFDAARAAHEQAPLRTVDYAEVEGLTKDLLGVVGTSLDNEIIVQEAANAARYLLEGREGEGGDMQLPPVGSASS